MDLIFDRGTLLAKHVPDDIDLTCLTEFTWDQRVGHYRAPAHRYWKIMSDLKAANIPFQDYVDQSKKLTGSWNSRMSLRPYQEAAIQSWAIAGGRGLVVLPTGSGKTNVAIGAITKINASALCLVPTRILLEQWYKQLRADYSGKVGFYGDGAHELGEVTVATYESAYRNMSSLGSQFGLIVIDEAHHFGNGIRDEIFEMAIAKYRLGLTGTLPRNPGQLEKLSEHIGSVVYELAIADLSGTFLAEFDLYSLHLGLKSDERSIYDLNINLFRRYFKKFREACPEAGWTDFVRIASQSSEGRSAIKGLQMAKKVTSFTAAKAETVSSLLERHRERRVLVFTGDAESTYAISRKHLVTPITAEIGRKEREESIARFREGRIKALVSCRVLNEGFDVPDAEVAIIVGGMHGEREHLQRIGRILRPSQGKKATVYELICRDTIEVRQSKKRNETIAARKIAPIYDQGRAIAPTLSRSQRSCLVDPAY